MTNKKTTKFENCAGAAGEEIEEHPCQELALLLASGLDRKGFERPASVFPPSSVPSQEAISSRAEKVAHQP